MKMKNFKDFFQHRHTDPAEKNISDNKGGTNNQYGNISGCGLSYYSVAKVNNSFISGTLTLNIL